MLSFNTHKNVLKSCFPLHLERNKQKLVLWLPPQFIAGGQPVLSFTWDRALRYTQRLLPTAHTTSVSCLVLALEPGQPGSDPLLWDRSFGQSMWEVIASWSPKRFWRGYWFWSFIFHQMHGGGPLQLASVQVSEAPEHTTYGCEHWWWSWAPSHVPQDKPQCLCVRCAKAQEKCQHLKDVHEEGWILSGHHEMKGCKIDSFPERKPSFQKLTYLSVAMQSSLVYFRHWMTSWSWS